MTAVWMRVRLLTRARLAASVALAVVIGLAGGTVLAAAAGARRTQSAYPRLLETTKVEDILVSAQGSGQGSGFYAALAKLPEVTASGVEAGINLSPVTDGKATLLGGASTVSLDGAAGFRIHRSKIIAGRYPDPNRIDEAFANRTAAQLLHAHVGERFPMRLFTADQPQDPDHVKPNEGIPITVTITGIGLEASEVFPISPLDSTPQLFLGPALWRKYGSEKMEDFDGIALRLKPGTDAAAFQRKVVAVAQAHPASGGQPYMSVTAERTTRVLRAIRPQSLALAMFAGLAFLATLVILGQALARQLALDAIDDPVLRAAGMTGWQLFGVALIRAACIAVGGAFGAVLVAFLASPLTPIGPARVAEPTPGFAFDVTVLAAGGAAFAFIFVAWAAVPAIRLARSRRSVLAAREYVGADRPSALASAAARSGLPPSAASGVRMALEPGRGRSSVPVRTAVLGTAIAVASIVAAVAFGSSFGHLVGTPRLYGWNWDSMVDAQFGTMPPADVQRALRGDRNVAAFAGGSYGTVTIGRETVSAIGFTAGEGALQPTMVSGRVAKGPTEITLGPRTLTALGRRIGDRIDVTINSESHPMTIVGAAVFPSFGQGSFPPTNLGQGAFVDVSYLLQPPFPGAPPGYNFVLARFRDGVDRRAAEASFEKDTTAFIPPGQCSFGPAGTCFASAADKRPADITNFSRVRSTPFVLAGLLALLGALTLGHTLVTSIRRRRRDLAVLRTIGFAKRQVMATVAWQSTTFALLAAIIGVPLGFVAGRWLWQVFANGLGVNAPTVAPLWAVLLPIPAAVLLANLIAVGPGWIAGRIRPAIVLRSE